LLTAVYLDFFGLGRQQLVRARPRAISIEPDFDSVTWLVNFDQDLADPEGELSGDNFILLRNGEPLFPPHWSDTWKNGPRQFAIQPDTYAPILPEDTWSLQQITEDGEIISLDTGLTGTTWGPLIWP